MISTLLTTLLIINAIVLVFLIVVLQQGSEGGISGTLGGGNSQGFFGASGGVKSIIRATWICGILFFALAMASAWVKTHDRYALKNSLEKTLSEPTHRLSIEPGKNNTTTQLTSPVGPVSPVVPTPKPSSPTEKPSPTK
jgi:preprotein translocase subunit SecG